MSGIFVYFIIYICMHSYFILIFLNFFNISARRGEYTKGLLNLFQPFFSVLNLNQNFIYLFFFNLWDFHNCLFLFSLFVFFIFLFMVFKLLHDLSSSVGQKSFILISVLFVCDVFHFHILPCVGKRIGWVGCPFIIYFLRGEGGGLIGKHCLVGLLLFNKIFITSFNGPF